MIINRINKIMGYTFYAIGVSRVIAVILAFIMTGSLLTIGVDSAGYDTSVMLVSLFGMIVGFVQLIAAITSVPMICLNKSRNPEVVSGYWYALGAILIELLVPSIIMLFMIFVVASLYMKAGSKIIETNKNYLKVQKTKVKSDWFYNQPNRGDNIYEEDTNSVDAIKREKNNEKILEEIYAWRKLLDSGEIDEESYNEMKNKLLKKMQK